MRTLLVNPPISYKEYPSFLSISDFPAGFGYLASALRNAGHEVFGLNLNNDSSYLSAEEMLHQRMYHSLKEYQPELIGLGGLCTEYVFLKDSIQIIRSLSPDVPIVCGGGIINHDAEFVFKALRPDFCIAGEGEEALVKLAETLENGKRDYDQIDNLGYWKDGTPKFTRKNFSYMDIDKLCFPDYEPFGFKEMLDQYSLWATRPLYRYTRNNPRPMILVTARSCPFTCTFCVHDRGPTYRARSIANVMQEIAILYEQYHFNILVILDELFTAKKERFREFCIALLSARKSFGWDFDWCFQTHANASLNIEELKMAKEAGCYYFSYGIESASPTVLASMNKKTHPSQIAKAIELADVAKIGFGGNFIFGDLAETPETISESMNFFSQHCLGNHIQFGHVEPYPGSKLYEDCIEKGIIRDRLKFYEHLGEVYFNMTAMPDSLWLTWIKKLELLMSSFPWEKSATAFLCAEDSEKDNNPRAYYSGKSIYKVGVRCPYCTREAYYREPLDNGRKAQRVLFFKTFRPLLTKIILAFRRRRTKRSTVRNLWNFSLYVQKRFSIQEVIFSMVCRRHPLFNWLETFKAEKETFPFSFVTGCPYCHKRFRTNIRT